MSNKLYKPKPDTKHKVSSILDKCIITVFLVAFICIWTDVCVTTLKFNKQLSMMAEGNDYFIEEVVITDKKSKSSLSSHVIRDYYLYYDSAYGLCLNVDLDTYKKYDIGDKIPAYTRDHTSYYFKLEGVFPTYRNNQANIALGLVLGGLIGLYSFWVQAKF